MKEDDVDVLSSDRRGSERGRKEGRKKEGRKEGRKDTVVDPTLNIFEFKFEFFASNSRVIFSSF
jgi:predicted transposase YdaD